MFLASKQALPARSASSYRNYNGNKQRQFRINMKMIENRKNSYYHHPSWENGSQDPLELATHGFYFTGQEDIVVCYACEVQLSNWRANDDPLNRHFEASPNCSHIRRDHCGAIITLCETKFDIFKNERDRMRAFVLTKWSLGTIISPTELSQAGFFPTGKGVSVQCYRCGCLRGTWHRGESAIAVHKSLFADCPHLKEMARAKLPDYSSLTVRLQSFKYFPADSSLDKEELAKSGFYLLQPPTVVRCFACKLTLNSFEEGVLPDKIHLKKSPNCPMLAIDGDPSLNSEPMESSPLQELSPPPDPSLLPPPVMSKQDLQNMFKFQSPSLPPSLSQPPKSRSHNRSENITSLKEDVLHFPPSLALRNQSELDFIPRPQMILDQRVYLPPSYQLHRGGPITHSIPTRQHQIRPTTYQPLSLQSELDSFSSEAPSTSSRSDQCIICFVNPKEYAILPCGHLCCCQQCSVPLKSCPVCRCMKTSAIKIYDV